ncbi:MAG: type II 3-dehydroquinate dehydratase [Candidatus Binataceae bacterium]|nr:type II 3-dehydroquinate dehydratase [Candidatus Binataceae bacterium]
MASRIKRGNQARAASPARPARRGAPAVLVVHGPNLNLLGEREPGVYGRVRLKEIDERMVLLGRELGMTVTSFQSNSEGAIVDRIQAARGAVDIIIINPAAYTHTSVAIRDVLLAVGVPFIEVHLSNVYKREPMRHHSTIADVAVGRIMGFGAESYMIALRAARSVIDTPHA